MYVACNPTPNVNSFGIPPDPEIPNEQSSHIEPISLNTFEFDMRDSDVAISSDGKTILATFLNDDKLYSMQYKNNQWQDITLLGDNDNHGSSESKHQLIMNKNTGVSVLLHWPDYRISNIPNTFALSYFDGNQWVYTAELENPIRNFSKYHEPNLCTIDESGKVYIAHKKETYNFTVSILDITGLLESHDFIGECNTEFNTYLDYKGITTDSNNRLLFQYIERVDYKNIFRHISRIKSVIFDGSTWDYLPDIISETTPSFMHPSFFHESIFLKLYTNNEIDMIDYWLSYYHYDGSEWQYVNESNYNGDQMTHDISSDFSVNANETGEILWVARSYNSETYHNLVSIMYDGNFDTSIIEDDDWEDEGLMIFPQIDNSFYSIWEKGGIPMINYLNGKWDSPERITNKYIVDIRYADYELSKNGILIIATGNEYIAILKPSLLIYKLDYN